MGESERRNHEALVSALRRFFSGQADVIAAYLFGSRAAGRARPGSDVDVAVLLSEDLAGGAGWVLGIRAADGQPDSLPRPYYCPGLVLGLVGLWSDGDRSAGDVHPSDLVLRALIRC